jgi:hypothetical protein
MQLAVATLETTLDGALGLGALALTLAEAGRATLLSASFEAEALVLGRLQREDTLRTRSAARFDVPIVRRATTGTEAQLSGPVLYHALALPRVDALYPDASARTLLNRNLRALLRGYAAAGVPFRYFGTEVLAILGHPVAVVGYEQSLSGAVLIEVLIGLRSASVVRPALKREPPAALYAALRSEPLPRDLLQRAVRGVVERLGATTEEVRPTPNASPTAMTFEGTPSAVAIPLGVVEAVVEPRVRFTGDLLVGTAALREVEQLAERALRAGAALSEEVLRPLQGSPLDGARPADLLQALQLASG